MAKQLEREERKQEIISNLKMSKYKDRASALSVIRVEAAPGSVMHTEMMKYVDTHYAASHPRERFIKALKKGDYVTLSRALDAAEMFARNYVDMSAPEVEGCKRAAYTHFNQPVPEQIEIDFKKQPQEPRLPVQQVEAETPEPAEESDSCKTVPSQPPEHLDELPDLKAPKLPQEFTEKDTASNRGSLTFKLTYTDEALSFDMSYEGADMERLARKLARRSTTFFMERTSDKQFFAQPPEALEPMEDDAQEDVEEHVILDDEVPTGWYTAAMILRRWSGSNFTRSELSSFSIRASDAYMKHYNRAPRAHRREGHAVRVPDVGHFRTLHIFKLPEDVNVLLSALKASKATMKRKNVSKGFFADYYLNGQAASDIAAFHDLVRRGLARVCDADALLVFQVDAKGE